MEGNATQPKKENEVQIKAEQRYALPINAMKPNKERARTSP